MATSPRAETIFPPPDRLVVIGDLNGDDDALRVLLCALGLSDARGTWRGGAAHLVQLGDVVNRGAQSRQALERLMRLQEKAAEQGGQVTVLLGNHEAMVTLGNLAWCTPEEILAHATDEERVAFEVARGQAVLRLLSESTGPDRRTAPIVGRLRAWEEANVPGKEAYLEAMGPRGAFGGFLRSLPLAVRVGGVLCVHGGLSRAFATEGLPGLQRRLEAIWDEAPETEADLAPESLLFDDDGPIWNRRLSLGEGAVVEQEIHDVLAHLEARTMVVGHTRSDQVPGEARGEIAVRFGGRLICADVGIGQSGGALSALLIEDDALICWRPDKGTRRIMPLPPPVTEGAPATS